MKTVAEVLEVSDNRLTVLGGFANFDFGRFPAGVGVSSWSGGVLGQRGRSRNSSYVTSMKLLPLSVFA